jgi:hypothetical protein
MKFKEMSLGALALCVLIMSLSSCADGSETPKKGGKTGPAILMSLSVSEAPVVHRTVELTLTVTPAISAENATIDIALPSGITRVSGDLRWKGKLVYNKPFDVKSQIQVAEAGEWKIEAKATARSVKDTYENTSVLYIQASDTTAKVFHGVAHRKSARDIQIAVQICSF